MPRCRLQASPNGLEDIEVIRTRTYLLGLLLMALALAIFASPVQAEESCCCEPAAPQTSAAACCCCEEGPAVTPFSCQMSCEQPIQQDLSFLIQAPPGFSLRAPSLSLELPEPPKEPAPPKSLLSSAVEEWAPPPSPPVASLNINLPPPSSQLL
jgi:hypothetical protein